MPSVETPQTLVEYRLAAIERKLDSSEDTIKQNFRELQKQITEMLTKLSLDDLKIQTLDKKLDDINKKVDDYIEDDASTGEAVSELRVSMAERFGWPAFSAAVITTLAALIEKLMS